MRDLKVNDERAAEIGRRVAGYRNHGHMTYLKRDVADLLADRAAAHKALRELVYEITHLSFREENGDHKCVVSARALAAARAFLNPLRNNQEVERG